MFKINDGIRGIEFEPHPELINHTDTIDPKKYRFRYWDLAKEIKDGKKQALGVYRWLILNDLFFIVYFVLGAGKKNYKKVNHPFIVRACNEVQDGANSGTLDIWAREHLKSSIITIGETIQYVLKDPDSATCIFSYASPVAKKFLFEIRDLFERNELLRQCFPDILWNKPANESPMWSLDAGLILKRKGNRKEPNIYASGLIEGMPTGMHFDRMIFDDIVTEDIAESVEVMEKVKTKIDSAMNLGTDGGIHRIIGTYYHHKDPLVYVRDKKDIKGNNVYLLRLKPATDDGTANGKPIYLSQERLDFLKTTKEHIFNCQQLLNPTPKRTQKLNPDFLQEVDIIPKDLYKFMVIDPAGSEGRGDYWAIHLVGVQPTADEIGGSSYYVLDSCIEKMGQSEAIDQIIRMYIKGGYIQAIGIEKVGLSTAEIHVAEALKKKGKHISVKAGSLILLNPAGRNKTDRIESSLAWSLNNGKIFISKKVNPAYIERLKTEMAGFPYGNYDDGIDALSYIYDMAKNYHFSYKRDSKSFERRYAEAYLR